MAKVELVEKLQLDPAKATAIVTQGWMIHTMVYSQRCKLHLPYLMRGYVNPTYAYSHDIWTKAACLIIQNHLKQEVLEMFKSTLFHIHGLLFGGVFTAAVTLLMDFCLNKASPQQEKHRGEVVQAFRILKEARGFSATAAKLRDSLIDVLRKHQVAPPMTSEQRQLKPENGEE